MTAAFALAALAGFAQKDTTTVTVIHDGDGKTKSDTIRIGGMTIIKNDDGSKVKTGKPYHKYNNSSKRVETSWLLLDLGYSNYNDQTDYNSAAVKEFTGNQPFNGSDFDLRNGKSFNINVWLFRQRLGITKNNAFNLTYGFMIETTNFRYENNVSHLKGGPPYIAHDSISFKKNKLATSYFTVPVMLGVKTSPKSKNTFNLNVGASIGYRYSTRNKQISDERGKQKIKGNFNMEPWKLDLIAEAGFNWIKIYGSYSPNSMYKSGLDMRPYTIGLRFGGSD